MQRKSATRRDAGDRPVVHGLIQAAACLTAVAVTWPAPAGAQPIELHTPGATTRPSEMAPPDTRGRFSAAAPIPPSLAAASVNMFLQAARRALAAGRMGEAREALERAETRLLQSSAGLPHASSSGGEHTLRAIAAARGATAARDRQGALRAIDDAATAVTRPVSDPNPGRLAVAPTPSAPAQAMFTHAVLPGHWQLEDARYVWIPPGTVPRPVQYWPLIPGRYVYVWRDGKWVWVPAHYGGN